ncbi:uncharacterized protein LOC123292692 [Chrysoperla carnea]|uniref:uncharacterized protein LOC123292692 n=1 Tax=Chrysoperla carnea TaxID=189513 RepID=UPI001D09982B|nr:uncharacterized protein LOC123292692 [Chrysoperla carnea]
MAPHNLNVLTENRQQNQAGCQSTLTDEEGSLNTTSSSDDSISLESDQSGASTNRDGRTYSPVVVPTITTIQQMLIETAETNDLDSVKEIEFKIQDEDISLQKLSTFLPNLNKINLYGSVIKTIRALGSELDNLKILNIGKCNLVSLDGLMGLPNLEELYAESNFIEDVGPCAFTSRIKTLNLNNNKVSDIQCVGFLSLCLELRHIYLEGCPVSKTSDYRRVMKYLLPQLVSLDGQSFGVPGSNSMSMNDNKQSTEMPKRPSTTRTHNSSTHSSPKATTPRQQHPSSFLRNSSDFSRPSSSQDITEILNISQNDVFETSLKPHILTRNIIKLPPLKNTRIISTPFDNRPATTSSIPSSSAKIADDLYQMRPSTSRAFSRSDYIADLETVKEKLKNLPTLCNPFSGDIFEEIQWRARSALYRSQIEKL